MRAEKNSYEIGTWSHPHNYSVEVKAEAELIWKVQVLEKKLANLIYQKSIDLLKYIIDSIKKCCTKMWNWNFGASKSFVIDS